MVAAKGLRVGVMWLLSLWTKGLLLFLTVLVLQADSQAPTPAPGPSDGIQEISQQELSALLACKRAFLNPKALASWNESGYGACYTWLGVRCSNGQVSSLVLPGRGILGTIPEDIGNLTGLRKLSLHSNSLHGSIPQSIGFLVNLKGIALFDNDLSGSIPENLGNSSVLQALDLSYNRLTGALPSSLVQSLRLLSVDISYNNLTGPVPSEWTKNTNAIYIGLASNQLSGSLPSTWGVAQYSADSSGTSVPGLVTLNLRQNFFSGTISSSFISSLGNLSVLLLGHNQLQGTIPEELTFLTELTALDLSNNFFTGSIPSELPTLLYADFSGNNLSGSIPSSLGASNLTFLALSGNQFSGGIPDELGNLAFLTSLDLNHNKLNGSIPNTFSGLHSLQVLNLAGNQLTGNVPGEIGNLSHLTTLDLSSNALTGPLPSSLAQLGNLTSFNVSYNNLSGPIPTLAHSFNSSSFLGNVFLCGILGLPACPPSAAPTPGVLAPELSPARRKRHHHLSTITIICIVLGSTLAALAVICFCLLCAWRQRDRKRKRSVPPGRARTDKQIDQSLDSDDVGGKLVHFDGPLAFSADHLLCATAEVLGKSAYGTVYKATLEDGNIIAVKRLREGIVKGQKDFETEVGTLGRIRHPNLLALRAYYWGPKDEKLLVFDYMSSGSLAAFLHARGPETPLNWLTRMKIVMGAARGLAYLHDNENIVHGNLTASNILLDGRMNARISDYGLSGLMTPQAMSGVIASAGTLGYRAPELAKTKKATTKSDTYSFGIVLLELLTGKAPTEPTSTDSGMDLAEWVSSVVKEEWTSEVFDLEIIKENAPHAEEEMMNALQLALMCVNISPNTRPEMDEVVRQLEEIRPDLRQSPDVAPQVPASKT